MDAHEHIWTYVIHYLSNADPKDRLCTVCGLRSYADE